VIAEYMEWSWGGWHSSQVDCTSLEVGERMLMGNREQSTKEVALSCRSNFGWRRGLMTMDLSTSFLPLFQAHLLIDTINCPVVGRDVIRLLESSTGSTLKGTSDSRDTTTHRP
jgi:hypothetical protein